jgi:hypothetical protein
MRNILFIFSRNILPARRSAELAGDLDSYSFDINFNLCIMRRHRNPKKIGFWMWFWIFKSKTKIKPKYPKNQKTTSKTKP